jgi:hypothetical protein
MNESTVKLVSTNRAEYEKAQNEAKNEAQSTAQNEAQNVSN